MTQLTPTQIEAIADENGALYQRDIIKTTFKTRTQGFWAGSLVGLASGIGIGLLVGLAGMIAAPIAAGGALTYAGFAAAHIILAPTIGAFALTGMLSGAAIMTSVNASASAAVGLAKVNDRKLLLNDPNAALAEAIKYRGTAQNKETFWNTLIPFNKGSKSVFTLRNALIFGTIGLAAGGIFLSLGGLPLLTAAVLPVINQIAGAEAAKILVVPLVMKTMAFASCGLFGAFFGVDGPTIGANATQFVGDIFGGKGLNFGMSKSPQVDSPSPSLAQAMQSSITPEDMSQISEKLGAHPGKITPETIRAQQLQPAAATHSI